MKKWSLVNVDDVWRRVGMGSEDIKGWGWGNVVKKIEVQE